MEIDLIAKVNTLANTCSDINEHFPAIIEYGEQCSHITEMGVRGIISTWGWLSTNPKKLVCYDIQDPSIWGGSLQDVKDTAQAIGTEFDFHLANVLEVEIEETDLLFLDTWHAYKQLKAELALHASKVRKYICFHDTTSYGEHDENSYEVWGEGWRAEGIGIWKAIEEFLESHPEWVLEKRFTHNNGFTVIKRVS